MLHRPKCSAGQGRLAQNPTFSPAIYGIPVIYDPIPTSLTGLGNDPKLILEEHKQQSMKRQLRRLGFCL